MKQIFKLILIITFSLIYFTGNSCTVVKITKNGKTIVGNNEDYFNPNTRIWFEQGGENEYGAVFVGFDDYFAQGGMNETGLVCDGFAVPYLAIKNTVGKKERPQGFIQQILKSCSNVEEVKSQMETFNLTGFERALWFFVDKSGKYLIVEGDSMIIGNDSYYVQSNFYPSQTKNLNEFKFPPFHTCRKMLDEKQEPSVDYCTSLMDTVHKEWKNGGGTLYTTIYDLENNKIYLYHYWNYEKSISFDLKQELEKGNHKIRIPDLFPENLRAKEYHDKYNLPFMLIQPLYNDSLKNDQDKFETIIQKLHNQELPKRVEGKLNQLGYEWLYTYKKCNYAIEIFELIVNKFPKSANAYDSLGEAYLENKQYDLALKNYQESVKLNPDNKHGLQQIKEIEKIIIEK